VGLQGYNAISGRFGLQINITMIWNYFGRFTGFTRASLAIL